MEFWRIFRLVWSKRWLIAGIMAISAVVILVGATIKGQQKLYEAVAVIAPLDSDDTGGGGGAGENGPQLSTATTQQDVAQRISNLVMQLKTSNDLYLKAAELLKQGQKKRTEAVKRILEVNGYFQQSDADIDTQIKRALAEKEINQAEAGPLRKKQQQDNRSRIVASLVEAKDGLGAFKEGGIELSPAEIADVIRAKMTFDIVTGPLDSETNRQIVNQIRVAGRFDREAEANLYTNMICVAFIDFYSRRYNGIQNARMQQTEEKLEEAKRQLDEAQKAESRYTQKQGNELTRANEALTSESISLRQQRDAAEGTYNEALATVKQLEAQLAQTPETVRNILPSDESASVKSLQDKVDIARADLDALKKMDYGDEWDAVKKAKATLNAAVTSLNNAKKRPNGNTLINPLRQSIEGRLGEAKVARDGAYERYTSLNNRSSRADAKLATLPPIQFNMADLRRNTAIADRYVTSLTDQKRNLEIRSITESKAGSISIVSQAHSELVGGDIAKQRPQLLVFGLVLSLICGVALVVGMDALDNSIRTVQDVERTTKLPVVGVIPEHLPDPVRAPRVTYLSPLAPVSEAYRLVRTNLLFTAEEKPFRSLMVATNKPGQGATTTISNIAITLAQAGKRVILVDTDLRFPKLHRAYGLSNDVGLTTLLRGDSNLEDSLQSTDVQNLQLLTTGPMVMNPSELLGSTAMRNLHEQLKKLADYVLFDTPSAVVFADASLLSSFIDVTLLVVRASHVPRGTEDHVMRLLDKARANLIGVVLNGVPSDQVDSVHYHDDYYPSLPEAHRTGAYGNSSEGTRPVLPLALPGDSEPMPAGSGGGRGTITAAQAEAAVLQAVAASPQMPKPRRQINWRLTLVILTAGIALGTIILRVAMSINSR